MWGLHVLDCTTERMGDRPVMNGLFTQPKVSQLHVAWEKKQHVMLFSTLPAQQELWIFLVQREFECMLNSTHRGC